MQNMRGKNTSLSLGLEILTPVQAGSGANLAKNIDYMDSAGKVFVVDQERTFDAIAAGDSLLDSELSSVRLDDLVKLAGRRFGYALPPLSGQNHVPEREFREHVKDAFLQPYIPGTALKGAIRTVLFASIYKNFPESSYKDDLPKQSPRVSAKMAAKKLTDNLFGKYPNHDLMRALHVGDAVFGQNDLRLADIRWMNLTGKMEPYKARWRDMPTRISKDRWQEAVGLHAETLALKSLATVTLQWDGFLLSNLAWHSSNPIPNVIPKGFDELRERLNAHATRRLQDEMAFYQQYGQTKPMEECKRLLALIDQEPQAAYLQLSWGSGWRGMTGDWMREPTTATMRSLYPEMRGRDGMPFPKTRRLAVYENSPCLPLGWIRLLPIEKVADRLQQQAAQQQQHAARCPWVDETIAKIMKAHNSKEDEALKGKSLAEAWGQIPDIALQQAALADIRSRWQAKGWWEANLSGAAKKAKVAYQAK